MLSAKKTTVTINPVRNYQRELQQLYDRRTAIDSLIASLEEYDRYKATVSSGMASQRRSA
jgi:hypothetical protein